jgi:hypothetical protein
MQKITQKFKLRLEVELVALLCIGEAPYLFLGSKSPILTEGFRGFREYLHSHSLIIL